MHHQRKKEGAVHTQRLSVTTLLNWLLACRASLLSAVLQIHEAAFVPKVRWLGPQELRVTIDCDSDGPCGADPQRHWSVTGSKRWEDVRITYAVGDRLQQSVSNTVLSKLPR